MTTNFIDIDTSIKYIGYLNNNVADVVGLTNLNTQVLLLTKTIVANNGTNYTVTAISDEAFFDNTRLASVDFGGMGQLTSIGELAFYNNVSLVELNNFTNAINLKIIGDDAFQYANLASVDFGGMGQLTSIGNDAFYYNTNLTELKNFTKATKLEIIGNRAFENAKLASVDFGGMGQLTSIGKEAFYNNTNLIELKNFTNAINLKIIDDDAFQNAYSLKSVDFGGMGQLTSIGNDAFYYNTNLTELKNFTKATKLEIIGNRAFENAKLASVDFGGMGQLTSIGKEAFYNNTNLIELKNFTNATKIKTIGDDAFAYNELISVDFGGMGQLTSIGNDAFYYNVNLVELTNFTNATKLEIIGEYAFGEAYSLQSVDFGGMGNLTSIDYAAFYYNESLTELTNFTKATKLKTIGKYAFQNAYSLQSVDFGGMSQLTSIGNYGFSSNISLTELKNFTKATKLEIIGNRAFEDAYSLQSVDFGGMSQLTSIGNYAFLYNISLVELKNFTNATKLQTIGEGAFYYNNLKSVDFGGMSQLTSIDYAAFYYNTNLTELTNFTKAIKLEIIDEYAFGSANLKSVDFGGMGQLTSIGNYAFYSNISLTSLNFGNLSQTTLDINSSAFDNCNSLRKIFYKNTNFLTNLTSITMTEKHMYIQLDQTNNVLNVDFQKARNLESINTSEFVNQSLLTELKNFTNATNLKIIDQSAFQSAKLTSVDFVGMGQLTSIGNSAFYNNASLIELNYFNFSTQLKRIDQSAFQNNNIQTIFFPKSLTNISSNVFGSNINLREITFSDPAPSIIDSSAFANCTNLKSIYHYGINISQITQLTAIAGGNLYNLNKDKITVETYQTQIAVVFDNINIVDELEKSDIKTTYALNIIQVALNGKIFDPKYKIKTKVGAIPFLAEQLNVDKTQDLILYSNYTTSTDKYDIKSNIDPAYFHMNIGSVLYLSNDETITKNADNTYTYSNSNSYIKYNPGEFTRIEGRTIVFGGVGISETRVTDCKSGQCNPEINIIKSAVSLLNKNYYSDTKGYLRSRCQTYNQKLSTNPIPGNNYTSQPSDSSSGSQVYYTDNCSKKCATENSRVRTIYKPNNQQYSQQGAVDSSSRLTRLKYKTINKNGNSFKTNWGNQGANAGSYKGTSNAPYFLKSKNQVCVPQHCDVDKEQSGLECINIDATSVQEKHLLTIKSRGQTGQPPLGTIIFQGYLIVDTTQIVGIYENCIPINIQLPNNDSVNSDADSIFPLTENGVNFKSETLLNGLGTQGTTSNFNLYNPDNNILILYNGSDNIDDNFYEITIS